MGASPFQRHIFPEPIPVCGIAPAVVPCVDPGFALAEAVQGSLQEYKHEYGVAPKMLLMINHELVTLGQTAQQALNITLLADKWARIILGTYALEGPSYLSAEQVDRFADRLDEKLRQR